MYFSEDACVWNINLTYKKELAVPLCNGIIVLTDPMEFQVKVSAKPIQEQAPVYSRKPVRGRYN